MLFIPNIKINLTLIFFLSSYSLFSIAQESTPRNCTSNFQNSKKTILHCQGTDYICVDGTFYHAQKNRAYIDEKCHQTQSTQLIENQPSQSTENATLNPTSEKITIKQTNIVQCKNVKILLTFDDGPHPKFTKQIVEILNSKNITGLFFLSADKLDNIKSHKNNILLTRLIAKSGHFIGSHGYHHHPYDYRIINTKGDLDPLMIQYSNQQEEINKAENNILNALGSNCPDNFGDLTSQFMFYNTQNNSNVKLFRFPYGRGVSPSKEELLFFQSNKIYKLTENSHQLMLQEYRKLSFPLNLLHQNNYLHLGWNNEVFDDKPQFQTDLIDENLLNEYINLNYQSLCAKNTNKKGPQNIVALFHDTKKINAEAIGILVDMLLASGASFVSPELGYLPGLN